MASILKETFDNNPELTADDIVRGAEEYSKYCEQQKFIRPNPQTLLPSRLSEIEIDDFVCLK